VTSSHLYASGRIETPTNYIDIGQLDLTTRNTSNNIFLPYIKPAGIDRIITSSVRGLIIEEMIVDGRRIRPNRTIFNAGSYTFTLSPQEEIVDIEEGHFTMPMLWRVGFGLDRMHDDWLQEGIYFQYFSRNGQLRNFPDRIVIPYGSNEIFITYRIRFPYYPEEGKFGEFIVSEESYTVKFNILWPELRIADRHGRIAPPEDYCDLGVHEFNSYNELVIELPIPIEFPNPNRFNYHINDRWLIIYELISDGVLINSGRLNLTERNNIDYILTRGEIIENNTKIQMKLNANSGGINIFLNRSGRNIKYTIPYNSREIYLTYDILFNSNVGYSNHNRRHTIRWEISWN
jgi:hypothetical protein